MSLVRQDHYMLLHKERRDISLEQVCWIRLVFGILHLFFGPGYVVYTGRYRHHR